MAVYLQYNLLSVEIRTRWRKGSNTFIPLVLLWCFSCLHPLYHSSATNKTAIFFFFTSLFSPFNHPYKIVFHCSDEPNDLSSSYCSAGSPLHRNTSRVFIFTPSRSVPQFTHPFSLYSFSVSQHTSYHQSLPPSLWFSPTRTLRFSLI